MRAAPYRRGQPIMTLAAVLIAWISVRAATWDMAAQTVSELPRAITVSPRIAGAQNANGADTAVGGGRAPLPGPAHHLPRNPAGSGVSNRDAGSPQGPVAWVGDASASGGAARLAAHPAPPPIPFISPEATPRNRRWSADAWMMLRDGGASSPVSGPARATYGASQLGAVVRYRLATGSGHRPTAYLRGTAALIDPHDREVATGLSARPFRGVPLTVAAELRAGEINSETRVRPAIMAVSELMPQTLPLGLLGEAYVQAGYVGGTGATAFVDGQLRVDGAVARLGDAQLRLGVGAWGGAQKDASRLDLGPAMNLGVSVSDAVFARVMLDWRFRVAGNAVPESGPALTLSAGF